MVVLRRAIGGMRRRFSAATGEPVAVRLYGRPGCHLCEDAEEMLERLAARYPLRLRKIDITTDPALVRRFDILIPVIVIEESVELTAPITERTLAHALATASKRR